MKILRDSMEIFVAHNDPHILAAIGPRSFVDVEKLVLAQGQVQDLGQIGQGGNAGQVGAGNPVGNAFGVAGVKLARDAGVINEDHNAGQTFHRVADEEAAQGEGVCAQARFFVQLSGRGFDGRFALFDMPARRVVEAGPQFFVTGPLQQQHFIPAGGNDQYAGNEGKSGWIDAVGVHGE